MSTSLYYTASRATALTAAETTAIERVVTARQASFPCPDEESLFLYEEPDAIVAGSTKMPFDVDRVMPVLEHVLGSVTELRRALPDAEWQVHLDDFDIPWNESEGYFLPA
ncbi:hypothetical protein CU254_37750 [Amycolatopsis sp. AA4]|uniref:hypothetical protein n=1 Tax=Actinomycetes TaxID=1760 RepID=UPI0002DD5842|nr:MULTISPECIES: hypothetical protein [Actinomycetes]ATY15494.1 hypothetical protein CU254_37750 [Amycolatopsis sp. AA4]